MKKTLAAPEKGIKRRRRRTSDISSISFPIMPR
jgi:hypothetical protein